VDIIRAMEIIQEGNETLDACSLGYYVLQKQKPLSEKNVQKEKGNVKNQMLCVMSEHILFNSPLLSPNIFLSTIF